MRKPAHPIALEASDVEGRRGTIYPKPFDAGFENRIKRALGDEFGLTQFGVNLVTLEPGAMSAQRHWHAREDEFVYVLEGTITLITDEGETELVPGMAAGFPAGEANGHHLVNRFGEPVSYLEVGTRSQADEVDYPDVDMKAENVNGSWRITRKDGTSFDE
ncbi:MAG: cupin domain-containing protein [Hyphomicrobiaceae bacterium]|nr:cupin domain-containing protein [Hyphomicrobiaceae bacterium]